MKKSAPKKKITLIIVAVVAAALLVLAICLICRVPARITAAKINNSAEFPCDFLSAPELSDGSYRRIAGFGTSGYYDTKYLTDDDNSVDFDVYEALRTRDILVYYTASWPDITVGSSRITRICCSDPEYALFGCHAGDNYSDFYAALTGAGFREDGNYSYVKNGIRISLSLSGSNGYVTYFTISAESGNFFGTQY